MVKNIHSVLDTKEEELLNKYCESNNCSTYKGVRQIVRQFLTKEAILQAGTDRERIKHILNLTDREVEDYIKNEAKRAKDFIKGVSELEHTEKESGNKKNTDTHSSPQTNMKKKIQPDSDFLRKEKKSPQESRYLKISA